MHYVQLGELIGGLREKEPSRRIHRHGDSRFAVLSVLRLAERQDRVRRSAMLGVPDVFRDCVSEEVAREVSATGQPRFACGWRSA